MPPASKRRKVSSTSPAVDRISNLPENVSKIILMHLPLRDAIRTSILSYDWRYRWNRIPHLVFDESCVLHPEGRAQKGHDEELVKIVNQVLFVHQGPIRKFKLSINSKRGVDLGRWILLLSRNGINELALETMGGGYYKLPSCFYSCEDLTDLRLFGCMMNVPLSAKGFGSLRTLCLHNVNFPNSELEILISLCPLMQILELRSITGCRTLNLYAPKLIDLVVAVNFEHFSFENTPLLRNLKINVTEALVLSNGVACKLSQVFGSLPKLEKLHIIGDVLWVMTCSDANKLPMARHLNCLSVDVDLNCVLDVSAVFRIFRSSPILQKLNITCLKWATSVAGSIMDVWKSGNWFSQLKIVEVTNFSGSGPELKFVEILLAYSPLLEMLQLELKQNVSGAIDILKEIVRFRRVSSRAEIIFRT